MTRKITVSLPDAALREYLQPHPDVTILEWDLTGEPPLPRIDIVVPPYMGGPQVLQGLEAVDTALVQSQSIGYDGVAEFLPAGRVFANAAGVHETSTAELALALILASQRELPRLLQNQQEGRWDDPAHRQPGRPARPDCRLRRGGQGDRGPAPAVRDQRDPGGQQGADG